MTPLDRAAVTAPPAWAGAAPARERFSGPSFRYGGPGAGPRVAEADAAAERALREDLRAEVGVMLGARQLVAPRQREEDEVRGLIERRIEKYRRDAANQNLPPIMDPAGLARRLFDALLRLGPLQPLMDDPDVEEIICNGSAGAFVIAGGVKRAVEEPLFESDDELCQLVKRLVGPLGKRLDESSPMVDARLPDGSRLNAIIPPASTTGCCVTIRKFVVKAQRLEDLVALGMLPLDAAEFLRAAVRGGVNVVVSGPTGAGKTTMLNALATCIADVAQRVVTIEEVAELQLPSVPDWVGLQARAANTEGAGEIRIRDLVKNALRMRPTRIVVGECRGGEALDMLQAMNTGHDGSLTTIHGNSPRDALDRLATLAMMAEERLGVDALTRMIARTVELVLQVRFEPRTGARRLVSVFEVTGVEGSVIAGNELWRVPDGGGALAWTGVQPRCLSKIREAGVPYAPPGGGAPERWSADWRTSAGSGLDRATRAA